MLSSRTIIVSILVISFSFLTQGCGKKANLHILTEEEKKQLKQEKLERDAVLEKRKERQNQVRQNTERQGKGTP